MYRKIINILKNKSIAIVGFGKEGRSTYKFIRKYLRNEKIFILDKNENLIIDSNTLINDTNVKIVLGKDYLKNILALLITIGILFILWHIPFIHDFFMNTFNNNPIFKAIMNFFN